VYLNHSKKASIALVMVYLPELSGSMNNAEPSASQREAPAVAKGEPSLPCRWVDGNRRPPTTAPRPPEPGWRGWAWPTVFFVVVVSSLDLWTVWLGVEQNYFDEGMHEHNQKTDL
jgi:hypothetical protein